MSQDHALIERHLQTALELANIDVGTLNTPPKRKTLEAYVGAALYPSPEARPLEQEPIRTIHHLSCTGGTLFAKCIASMANVLLLNEVQPYIRKTQPKLGKSRFTPTDMISLLHQADTNISSSLVSKLFITDLEVLRKEQWKIGRAVVLRDHSHSQFLVGTTPSDELSLGELVSQNFSHRGMVSVRNPIDSFLSMQHNGWHRQFQPSSFDEYCKRYLLFLEKYKGYPIMKYEKFVDAPEENMRNICTILDLSFTVNFLEICQFFRFSGDSGRSGGEIKLRQRRQISPNLMDAIDKSQHWHILSQKLNYYL